MTTKAVGPAKGWDWLMRAVNLGRNNPKAVFGGGALMILVLFAMVIVLSLATAPLESSNPDPRVIFGSMFIAMLPVAFVMAAMMVGFLRLIDAVESGRAASAGNVFAGFRDWPTSLRAIGFVILLAIIQNVVLVALVAALAPEFGSWYLQNLQGTLSGHPLPPPTTLPTGFGATMAVLLVLNLFFYALQAIGLGQIALRGSGIARAFKDGATGAIKNLLPMLVFVLTLLVAMIVLGVGIALIAGFLVLLGKGVGMWIVALVGIPLYIAFLLALVVVMFGVMYFLWRDICGDAAPMPASPADQLQA